MKLRDKKPLVISGDMALAVAITRRLPRHSRTRRASRVDGVVGGKIGFGEALERFGVHAETFPAKPGDEKAATRAAYLSPFVRWDDATRERVHESMTGIYDLFLARVAEGRKIPVAKVAASAEGRIFSGREGKTRGLVDELGGLNAAVAKARELAKLDEDAGVAAVESSPKFLDALGGGDVEAESPLGKAKLPALADVLERVAPDVVPFASALAPLAEGERHVTAVPFAVIVR